MSNTEQQFPDLPAPVQSGNLGVQLFDSIQMHQYALKFADSLLQFEKAADYYKAGMLKRKPKWVPSRVLVLKEQYGDHPFRGAGVAAGDYGCQCNRNGAVSVLDRLGKPLGLRLDEFEVLEWRKNE